MVKVYENTTYIFAVAMQNSPSTVRITIDDGHRPMLESSGRIGAYPSRKALSKTNLKDMAYICIRYGRTQLRMADSSARAFY